MKYLIISSLVLSNLVFAAAQQPVVEPPTQQQLPAQTKPADSTSDPAAAHNITEPAPVQVENLFWIFLTTGKSTEGVAREEIQRMQSEHLANFKRLAAEDKLLTAGPMNDPEKKLRGIVVVRAKNKPDIERMFQPDPYVQSGYLKIEPTPMKILRGTINTRITPQGLDEFRIVVLNRSPDAKTADKVTDQKNLEYLSRMSELDGLRLSVAFQDRQNRLRGVLIFDKPAESDESISGLVNRIPAVIKGLWQSKIMPLYMGKGSLSSDP